MADGETFGQETWADRARPIRKIHFPIDDMQKPFICKILKSKLHINHIPVPSVCDKLVISAITGGQPTATQRVL